MPPRSRPGEDAIETTLRPGESEEGAPRAPTAPANRATPPPWPGIGGRFYDPMMATPVPGRSADWAPGIDDTLVGDEGPQGAREGLPPRLDRYIILRQIGGGGMGSVYAAYDEQLDRKVAIKVLREARGGHEAYERLIREAQALARLAHPNVVMVHDVKVSEGQVYIAMEFIVGLTLRAWLAEADRSVAEIVAAFVQAGRGLAAAHAAALVHRDFKPDNVMVGADGRVRVLDFGLVRPRSTIGETSQGDEPAPGSPSISSSGSRLDDEMTAAGTILGTPAYMAPEQHLGVGADARTDIFAFCVALYEALYGARPFVGGTFDELRSAVLRGELDPPPPHSPVPLWIHRVLEVGLRTDPEERWQTMDALLGALGRDPAVRRRRRLRTLGLVAITTLVAVLVPLVGGALLERWEERQREAAAVERWERVQARVGELTASGRLADAEAVLVAFLEDEDHQGAEIVAEAWIERGQQLLDRGEAPAAMEALANAYSRARGRDLEIRTLLAIARIFVERHDFAALAPVVRALQDEGVADDPEVASMASRVALHDRRLFAAGAALQGLADGVERARRPLIAALTGATALDAPFDLGVAHDLDGDGRDELVLVRQGDAALTVVGGGGAIRGRHDLDPQVTAILPLRGRPFFAGYDGADVWIYELGAAGVRLRWRGPASSPPFSGAVGDLDGDGADELYLGLAAYRRGLFSLRLAPGGEAPPELKIAHGPTDAIGSDVNSIFLDDLDGDGRRELIAAVGPWRAYDLRVFHAGDDGLELAARLDLGDAAWIAPYQRADGSRVIAVAKGDRHANAHVFPEPPHTGPPAAVYMVEWTGEELTVVDAAPLPIPLGPRPIAVLPVGAVGDVDGDGFEDLILRVLRAKDGHTTTTLIGRQDGAGAIAWSTIGASGPLAAAELDGTPGVELAIADAARGDAAWILGLGGGEAPPSLARPGRRLPPPRGMDAGLRAVWRRAQRIAEIGFPAVAAGTIERALREVGASPLRSRLLLRVAELRASAGELVRARELLRELLRADAPPRDVLIPAAQILSECGELAAAGAALERADAGGGALPVDPFAVPELRELARRRAPVEIRFDEPLDQAWEIRDPAAVRRDSVGGRLEVAAIASPEPIARLPIAWSGGPLVIDVALDVRYIEYASVLEVSLSDEAGRVIAGVGYGGRGGGGVFRLEGLCHNPRTGGMDELFPWPFDQVEVDRRLRLQLAITPRSGASRCLIEADGVFTRFTEDAGRAPPPGRYSLDLRTASAEDIGLTRAAIASIRLDGATIIEEAATPQALRARLLAEEDAEGALAVLVPGEAAADRLIEALALASARRWREAEARLVDLWDEDPAPLRPILRRWLRTRPDAVAFLLQRALEADAYALIGEALRVPITSHLRDPAVALALRSILGDLEALPESAEWRALKVHLLTARGVAWRSLGQPLHARRDLQAAVAVADRLEAGDESLPDLRVALQNLAELTAPESPEQARRHVERLLEIAVDRDVALTALGRSRLLGPLIDAAPEPASVPARLPQRPRPAAATVSPAE